MLPRTRNHGPYSRHGSCSHAIQVVTWDANQALPCQAQSCRGDKPVATLKRSRFCKRWVFSARVILRANLIPQLNTQGLDIDGPRPNQPSLVNPEEEIEKVSKIFLNLGAESKTSPGYGETTDQASRTTGEGKRQVENGGVAKAPGGLDFRCPRSC